MSEPNRLARSYEPPTPVGQVAEPPPTTVVDLLRYLHARRVRLLTCFVLLAGVGAISIAAWWLFGTRHAHAVLALSFRGIEKHEYPSGKKFAIEDVRSPRVLNRALDELGFREQGHNLEEVYRGIDLAPIVPATVVERWKKQDRDGAKREEFLPNEFALDVHPKGFDDEERIQLLYALLHSYHAEVKYEQEAEGHRVTRFATTPVDQLVTSYDYWDIPILLRAHADSLAAHLEAMIRESQNFRDPTLNLSFREVDRDLDTWGMTRLEALAAVVHQERLVKDRAAMLRRLDERLANLDIQLQRINGEADAATHLLEVVDKPRHLLAGELTKSDGTPLIDATALERIVKSDYVGPVVRRVTELREQAARVAADKERVQHEIRLLSQVGSENPPGVPEGFEMLVADVARDLDAIADRYSKVLDGYLDATVTRYVTLREGPYVRLRGPDVKLVAAAVLFSAAILSLLIVVVSDSLHGRGPGGA